MTLYELTKKRCSSGGWALLIYHSLISILVTAFIFADAFLTSLFAEMEGRTLTEADYARMNQNAWGYILACLVGFLLVLLWKKKDFTFKTVFHQGHPMTLGNFLALFCLANCGQVIFSYVSVYIEQFLNIFGLTSQAHQESATMNAISFSMFLYSCIFAPVFEEFFFRGVLLRHLEPYGKRLAIFGSAFCFGMFHANVVQIPFAFFIGLIYGYTAMHYNILWSVVLHMFNNLVLSDILSRLVPVLGLDLVNLIFILVMYGSALAAAVIVIVRRKELGSYFRSNPIAKGGIKAFFLAPGMIVFNIVIILNVLYSLITAVL